MSSHKPQDHVHLLGHINDDNWLGYVGSLILISLGPISRAYLPYFLTQLRNTPGVTSLALDAQRLRDLYVRQVPYPDGLISAEEAAELFCEHVRESDNAVFVPLEVLRRLLLVTDEFDELQIGSCTVFPQGTLELGVCLPDLFNGRSFLVDGSINIEQLLRQYPTDYELEVDEQP
jgi:hypothetical protein